MLSFKSAPTFAVPLPLPAWARAKVAPGATIDFTGTGFVRDAGGGQTLNIKLNDIDIVASASPSPSASPSTTASGSVNVTTEVTKQNTSGTNSAELPKTGIEDSVPWLVVIALGALSLVLIRVSRAKN